MMTSRRMRTPQRRMRMKTTLKEWFPNYLSTDSIFSKMQTLGAPWTFETGQDMDDAYFTFYSGVKTASSFVSSHSIDGEVNSLTIARILWGIYGPTWTRLWNAYQTQYVPIDNYNVKETVDRNLTNNRNIDKTVNADTTSSGTDKTDYGEQINTTGESKSFTQGFNSSQDVPTSTVNETAQETHSGSDLITRDATSNSKTVDATMDDQTETENTTRIRQGNVGQNSYQELLRQEFELWKWNFFKRVFYDTDEVLALSVYDPCKV